MKLSLKILETNNQISNSILQSLLPEIIDYMNNGIQYIKNNLSVLINQAIINTPEYASLSSGKLQYELGIPDPGSKLSTLLDIWSKTIIINYKKPTINSNQIKGSFSVNMIRADFNDVLSTDAAIVNDSFRGYSLPWLEWLLLEGNRVIVPKQEVIVGPNKYSRTGYAIMRESSKSWKVPSEFAGTLSDNWITRAIDSIENDINNLLNKAFEP